MTGGLTPKNIDYITGKAPGSEGLFYDAMLDKGRVSGMLRSIPVYAVMADNLGERGALYMALLLLQQKAKKSNDSIIKVSDDHPLVAPIGGASMLNTSILVITTAVISGALAIANHNLFHNTFHRIIEQYFHKK